MFIISPILTGAQKVSIQEKARQTGKPYSGVVVRQRHWAYRHGQAQSD
jgi:hypothetical protein